MKRLNEKASRELMPLKLRPDDSAADRQGPAAYTRL